MRIPGVQLLCTVLVLAACHRDHQQSPAGKVTPAHKAPVAVKQGPSVAEQTAGMVEAATAGKSAVPVQLKFDLPQRPSVGQPLGVNIVLIPAIAADSATIQLSDSGGLGIAADAAAIVIGNIEPDNVYRQEIKVTPASDGVFFLNLAVTLKHDEVAETRVFTVPIIVTANKELAVNAKH